MLSQITYTVSLVALVPLERPEGPMSIYTELLTLVRDPKISNRSLDMTDKRRVLIGAALQVADAGLIEALSELLQYTGGWDLPLHGDHPISKARLALKRAGVNL